VAAAVLTAASLGAVAATQGFKSDGGKLAELNRELQGMEQDLLYSGGLPSRPWFKHMVYAAGLYTGYGAKTLPGAREAIEEQQWDTASQYIDVVAGTLNKYSAALDKATAELK